MLREPPRTRSRCAFTLVELLVVIGIIAVLISVLLPSLSAARKSASAIKCGAALREIGNAFKMYAADCKDWYPTAKYTGTYSIGNNLYPTSAGTYAYWQDFLAPYVTKAKVGGAVTTVNEQAGSTHTILWGCPNWDPYTNTTQGIQSGFGMNPTPTYTATYPVGTVEPPPAEWAWYGPGSSPPYGGPTQGFQRRGRWTQPAERALVADGRFWIVESLGMTSTTFPPQSTLQNVNTFTTGVAGQTTIDVYRHGKYPGLGTIADTFDPKGGAIGYNILYADGHVERAITEDVAYRAIRMRFPG